MHFDEVRAQVALGVVDGLQLILADAKLMEVFWHQGYIELTTRGQNGASMWFGRRAMVFIVLGIIGACAAYLMKSK